MNDSTKVRDWKGNKIVVGTRVKCADYPDIEPDKPPEFYQGTVTAISDPDGDVDDEGRSIGIPPYIDVLFDDGSDERYRTTWTPQEFYETDEIEVII